MDQMSTERVDVVARSIRARTDRPRRSRTSALRWEPERAGAGLDWAALAAGGVREKAVGVEIPEEAMGEAPARGRHG